MLNSVIQTKNDTLTTYEIKEESYSFANKILKSFPTLVKEDKIFWPYPSSLINIENLSQVPIKLVDQHVKLCLQFLGMC